MVDGMMVGVARVRFFFVLFSVSSYFVRGLLLAPTTDMDVVPMSIYLQII